MTDTERLERIERLLLANLAASCLAAAAGIAASAGTGQRANVSKIADRMMERYMAWARSADAAGVLAGVGLHGTGPVPGAEPRGADAAQ